MAGTFPNSWQEVALVTVNKLGGSPREFAAATETIDISEPDYPGESIPSLAGGRIWKQSPQEDGEVTMELYPTSLDSEDTTGKSISAIDGDATTITVTTSTAHLASVGDTAVITGTSNYNSTFVITGITSSTVFTIANANYNQASEATGTVKIHYGNRGLFQEFGGGTVDYSDTGQPLVTDTTWAASVDRTRDRFMVAVMWTDDTAQTTALGINPGSSDKVALRFYAKECRLVSHKSEFTDGILKTTVTFKFPAMNKAGTTRAYAWESTNDTDATAPMPVLTYSSAL